MAAHISAEETASHEILYVDSSEAAAREAESSGEASAALLELLLLRVLVASQVVNPLPFGVLEQLVGVDYLFELFLGPWVLFVSIGVVLLGPLLEAGLDLLLIGVARDAQDLVGVGDLGEDCDEEREEDEQQESQFVHLTCE